ncbi:MAG: FHA domain-containing protein [Planctomycetota bacterium]|nr:MAG: FHA domain-containing protein [Planctomycetota bacterium]
MNPPEPALVLRREGEEVARFPRGGVFRIGRHPGNGLALEHATVSTFHLRVTWARTQERPELRDEGSRNGSWLDGERLAPSLVLRGEGPWRLRLGDVELSLELVPGEALLGDATGERFSLFTDEGPELQGVLDGASELEELLGSLEVERRTGTLCLEGRGSLTFFAGKVMGAEAAGREGLEAVRRLLAAPSGTPYRFEREFAPSARPLGVWPSDLWRRLR